MRGSVVAALNLIGDFVTVYSHLRLHAGIHYLRPVKHIYGT
jgi:hypothetical protein